MDEKGIGRDGGRWRASPLVRLAAGGLLIGLSAVFVRLVRDDDPGTGPVAVAFWRMLFGGLVLIPLVLKSGRLRPAGLREGSLLFGAALLFACDLTLWHASIHRVGPGLATILGNLQAVVLGLVGWLVFREMGARRVLVSVGLAMLALYMLTAGSWAGGTGEYQSGVLFGLGTAFCYSGYLLTLRALGTSGSARLPPTQRMWAISLMCAILLAGFALVGGESLLLASPRAYLLMFLYGALCQGLAWVWISSAMPLLTASVSGLVLLAQPAVSLMADVLFFGRGLSLVESGGALLAGLAIWIGSSRQRSAGGRSVDVADP
ncbi:MAG TPA: DMT family transporter [Spirochaetota bacterium]|nr:DMT family transporter [Spirochaetota bacterium]